MNKNIIELLIQGKISEAEKLIGKIENMPYEVEYWVYRTGNITLYTLALEKLLEKESGEGHYFASYYLSMPLYFYDGAYSLALYHARRMLALDPTNVDCKRYLITFYEIPDRLIQLDEAVQLAQDVLKEDPECTVSKRVIENYNKKKVQ